VLRVGLSDPGMLSLSAGNEHKAACSWSADRLRSKGLYVITSYVCVCVYIYIYIYKIKTVAGTFCFMINRQKYILRSLQPLGAYD